MDRTSHWLIFILIPFFLTLTACKTDTNSQSHTEVRAVKYEVISEKGSGQIRQFSGALETADKTELSFQVGGKVAKVFAQLGDTVQANQLLAKLEPRDYELALTAAQARLESARATLVEKQDNLTRQQSLLAQSFVSEGAVEKAQASFEAAKSEVAVQISNVEEAERKLDKTILRAPYTGKIAKRSIEPFSETMPGKPAFLLQSQRALKVEVLVPETLISRVHYGQVVSITFPSLAKVSIGGTVSEIASEASVANAFPVRVQLADYEQDLRAGMTAKVEFQFNRYLAGQDVFMIPISAIDLKEFKLNNSDSAVKKNSEYTQIDMPIYLFDEISQTIKRHYIRVGDIRGNRVEVYKGLKLGDKIITAGIPFLHEGQKVKLWQPIENI